MLEIRNVTKRFGGLVAVHDVTTTVEAGKVNAIIGPNGAGKTTFFNLVSGAIAPSRSPAWASRAPSSPPRCSTWRRCWTT